MCNRKKSVAQGNLPFTNLDFNLMHEHLPYLLSNALGNYLNEGEDAEVSLETSIMVHQII